MGFRPLVPSSLLIALFVCVRPCVAAAQVSDMSLVERVTQTVQRSANFGIFDDVNVEVSNRAVTLTGRVTTPAKRDAIGDRVAKIDGLRVHYVDAQKSP